MPKTLEFFYDVISPWSYIAHTQLGALQDKYDVEIVYRPILLTGVFKLSNNQPPGMVFAKGVYNLKDMTRFSKYLEIEFNFPSQLPVNALLPMRALTAIESPEQLAEATDQLFKALWVDGVNVTKASPLADILGNELVELASTDEIKDKLKTHSAELVDRGGFGAPTFFLDQDEIFFGYDRLAYIEHLLAK